MNNAHLSLHRPLNSTTETPGRNLLRLLKTRVKLPKDTSNNDDLYKIEKEIISLLTDLSVSIQRRGLIHNSESLEKLSALSDGTTVGGINDKGGGKKRKRKADKSHSITAAQFGIHLDSQGRNKEESGEKNDLEEGKLLTALCRIVGVGKKAQDDDMDVDERKTSWEIVAAACQVIISICQHAIHGSLTHSYIVKDIVGSIACPLLDALCDAISNRIKIKSNEKDSASIAALVSALKASSSILCLVQTRCAQNKAGERTLQELRTTAWSVLNSTEISHDDVMKASAVLLASLPLAGDSDNTPQSTLWSQCVKEGILFLRFAINDFFPVNEKDKDGISVGTVVEKHWTAACTGHEKWISIVKESTYESRSNDAIDLYRRDKFLSRVDGLTEYLLALIRMEGYPSQHGCQTDLSFVSFPLQSILDISETLLSFPLAAEIKHRSLPSRLRCSPVDGGLISAHAAISIAASMRSSGHTLFDAAVSSSRVASYGKARRIVSICMSNLQSSVSRGLLSVVVEGRKSIDGRKDGISAQLRGSIPLRIKSIETFHSVITSLGSGVISSTATSKSISRGVVLVGGCLLEQIRCCGDVGSSMDEEWGTLGDRGHLVETCSNTLAGIVSSFGGVIPINVRGTIDSITHTFLSAMYSVGSKSVLAYSHVKQSLLQLGTNSVCVPWGDGGRSTLMRIVRDVASMLRSDPDVTVASRALSALCILDAIVTPRAPALLIPSRETVDDSVNTISAADILEGIKATTEDKTTTNRDTKQKKRKKVKKSEVTSKSVDSSANDSSKQITSLTTVDKSANEATNEAKSNGSKGISTNVAVEVKTNEKKHDDDTRIKDFNTKPTEDATEQSATLKATEMLTGEQMKTSNTTLLEEKAEESSGDDSSMEDFPEIVDEDPDEEDIG